jgi:hypothetical protein
MHWWDKLVLRGKGFFIALTQEERTDEWGRVSDTEHVCLSVYRNRKYKWSGHDGVTWTCKGEINS